jgi:transketolase
MIVGCGSGFSYSTLGCTHHATDDISIMRGLPNMTILSPADPREAEKVVRAAVEHKGPVYIRIGRSGEPNITPENYDFKIGEAVQLRDGKDLSIISTGSILYNALRAAERLKKEKGLDIEIINMHTLKPIDRETIVNSAKKTKKILTLEEHSVIGGLGSAVAEVLAESQMAIPFKRLGLKDIWCLEYGAHNDLEKYCEIAEPCIINAVNSFYGEKPKYLEELCGNCKICPKN